MRGTRLTGGRRRRSLTGAQAFVTDRTVDAIGLDADDRHHAVVELAIRDLKHGAGLRHRPSGESIANAAWAVLAAIAHALIRGTAALGLRQPGLTVAKTVRRRYLGVPGRMTRAVRRTILHLPAGWPWRHRFTAALDRLRRVPALR